MALPAAVLKVSVPSSFMVCAAGAVLIGASLTALTVMATASTSVWAPPEPVLPRSLVVTVRLALPLKLPAGANTRPFNAVLMLARLPVTVTVPVPLPLTVRPDVPARVSTPLVAASVTWTFELPASTSAMEMALPAAVLKVSVPSSFMACATGTVFTGASLMALTVMATVSVSPSAPPEPVLPRSLVVTVRLALPLKLPVGANTRPLRAVLMLVRLPVTVTVAVPLPLTVRPEMPARVSTPLVAASVTWTMLLPASTSAMEMALPAAVLKVSVPSSFMAWAAGTVFTGASFTALTVMATVSTSVLAPPEPVLPRSLVVTVRLALPLKLPVGANTRPLRAVLMLARLPVTVTVPVPLPLTVRPAVPARVSTPLVAASVTWTFELPASTSAMAMALPAAVLKVSVPSSFMAWAAGTVFTGASLTALTVMATVSTSVWAPPEPVLPRSLVVTVRLAAPLKLPAGANTRPLRAVLMLARVPVTVTVPVQLPETVRPDVPARVSTPLVAASVTWTLLLPASTSAMEMALPAAVLKVSVPSSFMACATGTVFTGASFTALTVMATVSTSVWAPPEPVLPRSLVVTVRLALPLKLPVGWNTRPLRAVLMLVRLPVTVTVAVPLPLTVRPVVPARVSTPLVAASVTWTLLLPASTSAMEMALPPALENVSVPSSFMAWATGTVFTGASLMALTVMATVSVSPSAPPEPVLPRSLVVTVRLAAPLKLPVGANTRPLRAVLMLARVPVTVTVPVPLPLTVRPAVPASVSTPLVAASVTWTFELPASTSAMAMALPPALENVSVPSSFMAWAAGTVFTGASLTALTVMATVSTSV